MEVETLVHHMFHHTQYKERITGTRCQFRVWVPFGTTILGGGRRRCVIGSINYAPLGFQSCATAAPVHSPADAPPYDSATSSTAPTPHCSSGIPSIHSSSPSLLQWSPPIVHCLVSSVPPSLHVTCPSHFFAFLVPFQLGGVGSEWEGGYVYESDRFDHGIKEGEVGLLPLVEGMVVFWDEHLKPGVLFVLWIPLTTYFPTEKGGEGADVNVILLVVGECQCLAICGLLRP